MLTSVTQMAKRMKFSVVGLPHYTIWHLYEPSVDDIRHMEEMEKEQKEKERKEKDEKEKLDKINAQFETPTEQWSRDKSNIRDAAIKNLKDANLEKTKKQMEASKEAMEGSRKVLEGKEKKLRDKEKENVERYAKMRSEQAKSNERLRAAQQAGKKAYPKPGAENKKPAKREEEEKRAVEGSEEVDENEKAAEADAVLD